MRDSGFRKSVGHQKVVLVVVSVLGTVFLPILCVKRSVKVCMNLLDQNHIHSYIILENHRDLAVISCLLENGYPHILLSAHCLFSTSTTMLSGNTK